MRGASALDRLLADFPDAPIRAQVVWEPVLRTDIVPPLSGVLGSIADGRVTQYWDPRRILSDEFVRSIDEDPARYGLRENLPPDFVAWDLVAVFGKSARWERDLPVPSYYGGPVRDVIDAASRAIAREIGTPAARDEIAPPTAASGTVTDAR